MLKLVFSRIIVYLIPILFLILLSDSHATVSTAVAEAEYVPGRLLVVLKDTDTSCLDCISGEVSDKLAANQQGSIDKLNRKFKVKSVKGLLVERKGLKDKDAKAKFDSMVEKAKKKQSKAKQKMKLGSMPDLSKTFIVEVDPSLDLKAILNEYKADKNVQSVQPDYKLKGSFASGDPSNSSQSYLDKIDLTNAWTLSKGQNIVVAVVDTGVAYHRDLTANMWTNPGEIPDNGIDDDANGFIDDVRGYDFVNLDNNPDDDNNYKHGTGAAGIIAAVTGNGTGIAGVAPLAKIMPVKTLNQESQGVGLTSDMAKGIAYAVMNGADVINLSWSCIEACPSNPLIEDAVRSAVAMNAVVVVAAGNTDRGADAVNFSPNQLREVITVGMSDNTDAVPIYSNYGSVVDVVAPGVSVISTAYYANGLDYYFVTGGTSVAAPHVSGLAALILARHPEFTVDDVRQAIQSGADDILSPEFDIKSGYGRINAYKSVAMDELVRPILTSPYGNPSYDISSVTSVNISGSVQGTRFADYSLYYKPVNDVNWLLLKGPIYTRLDQGSIFDLPLNNVQSGTYMVRLLAHDVNGKTYSEIQTFNVQNPNFTPPCGLAMPTIQPDFTTMTTIGGVSSKDFITFTNKNASNCPASTYKIEVSGPYSWWFRVQQLTPDVLSSGQSIVYPLEVMAPMTAQPGNYPFTIKITDVNYPDYTATTTVTMQYVTQETTLPAITFLSPLSGSAVPQGTVALKVNVIDSSMIKMVYFYVDGVQVNLDYYAPYEFGWNSAAVAPGTHTITAKAMDSAYNYGSASIMVQVGSGSSDTTLPVVSILSPASGAQLPSLVNIKANATDASGIKSVEFYVAGMLIYTDTEAPYEFVWNSAKFVAGSYTLMVKAMDNALNVGSASIAVQVMAPDRTPPVIAFLSPTSGAQIPLGSVTLQASASDTSGIKSVEFYVDGNLVNSDTVSPYEFPWSSTVGSHTLMVKATDNALNFTSASITVQVAAADTTPPVVSFLYPTSGAQISQGSVTLKASATDTSGVKSVDFYVDGNLLNTDTISPYEFVWNSGSVVPGSHMLMVKATDNAVNFATATIPVEVMMSADTTPPVVSFLSPTSGAQVLQGTVTLKASASDSSGINSVSFYVDGTLLGMGNVGIGTTSPYEFAWNSSTASIGSHTIMAKAMDKAQNYGSASITVQVGSSSINNVPKITPITIATATAGLPLKIAVTGTDLDRETLILQMTSGPVGATLTPVTASTFLADGTSYIQSVFNLTPTVLGPNSATFKVTDSQNATMSYTINFNVVSPVSDPSLTITSPANGTKFVPGKILVQATATSPNGVWGVRFIGDDGVAQNDTVAPYESTINTGKWAVGKHTISVHAYKKDLSYFTKQILDVEIIAAPTKGRK